MDMEKGNTNNIPRPHRCNARLEDFVQALYTWELNGKIVPAWKNFRACMKSEPGKEPTMPYVVITDPQQYVDGKRMKRQQ